MPRNKKKAQNPQLKLDKKIIAIYGPTISEKTGLAINIAKYIWGKYNIEPELISADSKKVYKELTVGPASIFPPYGEKIKTHMFRFIDSLEQGFSLYEYKTMAERIIDDIHKRRHFPIIFGGGATWISSVLENWNVPREWKEGTDYKKEFGSLPPKYRYIILIPEVSKTALFRKIDAYTKRSIKLGILDELIKLVKRYNLDPLADPTKNALYESLEYRQFLEYCREEGKKLDTLGKKDIEKIRKKSVKDLKNFARRQLQWIPKMRGEKHFVESWRDARQIVDKLVLE
jgi:tRNA A37 N6-isopentenylltransferase MiaA